jgi:tetratricopeptide (TPR) repeat protein
MSAPAQGPAGASAFLAAARRVAGVGDSLGEEALRLAYHAAVPVVVDAALLNLLRVNFFLDPPHAVPYEVEAELLLSPLFREVGDDLFEIEPGLRNILLSGLLKLYGGERVRRVAELLELYTDATPAWRSHQELEMAQRLTVVSFLDPARAEQWLDANESGAPSSPAAGSAPAREWYVAMRRRIAEHSAVSDVDAELARAVRVLRNADGVRDRLDAIESLSVLSRLPGAVVAAVARALCRFIESAAHSPDPLERVPADVQAALTLIGSLPHLGFYLEGVTLNGATLAGLNFARVTFHDVTLRDVNAAGLSLAGATLSDCAVVDTVLDRARLDKATLRLTELTRGSYAGTSFAGAAVTAVTMRDVDLSEADLDGSTIQCGTAVNLRLPQSARGDRPVDPAEGTPAPQLSAEGAGHSQAGAAGQAPGPGGGRLPALLERADAMEQRGDWAGARGSYQEAAELTHRTEPAPLEGLGRASERLGALDEAERWYEAALELHWQRDHLGAASTLLSLGRLALRQGHPREALTRFDEARSLLTRYDEPALLGRAHAGLGQAYATFGMYVDAERHYRDAVAHFRQARALSDQAEALSHLSDLLVEQGRFGEAIQWAERGATAFRELGDPGTAASLLRRAAEVIAAAGTSENALPLYWRALVASAEAAGIDDQDTMAIWHGLGAELARSDDVPAGTARPGRPPLEAAAEYMATRDTGTAALMLMRLPREGAGRILSRASRSQAGRLMASIAAVDPGYAALLLSMLPTAESGRVVDEMSADAAAGVMLAMTMPAAARLLESASAPAAAAILGQLPGPSAADVLCALPVEQAAAALRGLAPRAIAAILVHVAGGQRGKLLDGLPRELRSRVNGAIEEASQGGASLLSARLLCVPAGPPQLPPAAAPPGNGRRRRGR